MRLVEILNLLQIIVGVLLIEFIRRNSLLLHEMGKVYGAKKTGARCWISLYKCNCAKAKLMKFPPFMRDVPVVRTFSQCSPNYDRNGNILQDNSEVLSASHISGRITPSAQLTMAIFTIFADVFIYLCKGFGITLILGAFTFIPTKLVWVLGISYLILCVVHYWVKNSFNKNSDVAVVNRRIKVKLSSLH